ncbi:LPS export ABC transporter protein LptC [Hymenobacter luteus]|uniref:LPS export ABC transporter protein LptC n=2 Tax=Hymenobacter TaxID=89966 RepID=A0A7W9T3T9_9BACT|nr:MULTISPECIES: LPS export ABC transporter periplasmic protein LptC [Hymenobacter]MBB4603360.1 LPS export ABC transporter protein LptC [Hymenobacter latericoloratus]MBB6061082.1 LPS export ABC transporter protein LptC [Hymenobacter luteus]
MTSGYFRYLILVPGLLLASAVAGCHKREEEVAAKKIRYTGPTMETQNLLMIVSDSAKLRIRLTSPLRQDFENGNQIYPKGVEITFLGEDGTTVVNTIKGNYGLFDKSTSLYTLRGNVRVTNVPKQQSMNTEEAFFDQNKALIYTKKETEIRVTTPTEVLTGRGLTANQDFSLYSILNPTGVFTLQNAPAANPAPAATR